MSWMNYLGAAADIACAGASAYGAIKGVQQGKQQLKLAEQQAEAARRRAEEYKAIYGDLEKNLVDYYNKLSPTKRTNLGLDRYDKQFKLAQDRMQQNLAQRGLTGSGIEAEVQSQMEQQAITDRMNIAQQAEQQVMQEKLGFLGFGAGQSNLAQQAMANANSNQLATLNNQQANWNRIADTAGQSAGNIFSALMYNRGRQSGQNMF